MGTAIKRLCVVPYSLLFIVALLSPDAIWKPSQMTSDQWFMSLAGVIAILASVLTLALRNAPGEKTSRGQFASIVACTAPVLLLQYFLVLYPYWLAARS